MLSRKIIGPTKKQKIKQNKKNHFQKREREREQILETESV
jgi:hypothetical protein